ncbi:MAG: PAS sensor protein [Thermoplasmata archaeon]|nr:PAS sensor protein [Thermoplasmata archaeon]
MHDWVEEFPGAVTVCDMEGIILEMNERAKATFSKDGPLIGRNLRDCHPPKANAMIDAMLASGEKNVYTIEKNGVHKLIYQTPWFRDGVRAGLVEISLEIPEKMPHFKRS